MFQRRFTPRVPFGHRASRQPRTRGAGRRAFERGQTLIIFALSVTVLLGLTGLAVDVMRMYDLYARALRAAEAGALAADLYMPTFYSTANPNDSMTAKQRALQEVRRNGFGATAPVSANCDGYSTASEVTVCTKTSVDETAIQVTVTEPISVFLLSAVGVQSFSVSATAGADYLDPYVLGADPNSGTSNVWGDGGSSNPKNYMASINGPAEFKEMGDPYVYCEEGTSQGAPADVNSANAVTPLQDTQIGSVAGFNTNHAAWPNPQCGTAQPDKQPAGFVGEATKGSATHPGAYNFAINAQAGATVWIYNPPFSPTDASKSCNGSQQLDTYFQDNTCTYYYQKYGPITWDGAHFDDPRFAFDMTYSLYSVPSIYSRATDGLQASKIYHPMDQISADLSAHVCTGAYDMTKVSTYTSSLLGKLLQVGQGCVLNPVSYTWQQIGTASAAGLYRLAVEATTFTPPSDPNPLCQANFQCGWGRHSYAVAVCAAGTTPSGGTCTSGGTISAWNNMDLYLNFPSAKKNVYIPLAYIPATYAGRTVTISMFSPGDSHGHGDNAYYLLVPPDPCIAVTYPSSSSTWVRQANYAGTISPTVTGNCAQNKNGVLATKQNGGNSVSDNLYNGLWVPMTFTLPTSFTGGQFWLDEYSDQGKNFEEMAVSMAINGGSPLHLIF